VHNSKGLLFFLLLSALGESLRLVVNGYVK
jgi:hypothetical protein